MQQSERAVDKKIGRNSDAQKGKIVLGMRAVDSPDRIRSLGGAGAIVREVNRLAQVCCVLSNLQQELW